MAGEFAQPRRNLLASERLTQLRLKVGREFSADDRKRTAGVDKCLRLHPSYQTVDRCRNPMAETDAKQ